MRRTVMTIAVLLIGGAMPPVGGAQSPRPAAPAVRIPLCPGLTIVTAINQSDGDYESIKTIESVSAEAVRLKYSNERRVSDWTSAGPAQVVSSTMLRTLRRPDLLSATTYLQEFSEELPETIPRTTAIGASRAVLEGLKRTGKSEFGISTLVPGQEPLGTDPDVRPNVYDYVQTSTLERVASGPVMVPVIVNGVRTDLPSIHARGDFAGESSEFFFLDDPDNPLSLQFTIGIDAIKPWNPEMRELMKSVNGADSGIAAMFGVGNDPEGGDRARLRVVKIAYRCGAMEASPAGGASGPPAGGGASPGAGTASALERSLAESGRAEVYDIFFSFNSAQLRPESEPTLQEIAALLRARPEWTISIEGHTDSLASDAFNLDLSQRRSAAVKAALVTRFGIGASRLSTTGFGESRPRDTNDTLEGRARNRRVELVRLP